MYHTYMSVVYTTIGPLKAIGLYGPILTARAISNCLKQKPSKAKKPWNDTSAHRHTI